MLRRIKAEMRSVAASADAIVTFEGGPGDDWKTRRFGCWNLNDLSFRWTVPEVSSVGAICFSPDGKRVAVTYQTTPAPTTRILPNGKQVIQHGGSQKLHMALLDAATGKQLWRTEVKSLPSSIAFATEKLIVAEIYKFEI
jgi:hypothetical protein